MVIRPASLRLVAVKERAGSVTIIIRACLPQTVVSRPLRATLFCATKIAIALANTKVVEISNFFENIGLSYSLVECVGCQHKQSVRLAAASILLPSTSL